MSPVFNYDRYGRTTKSRSKNSDSFGYFWRSFLVPGWGEYNLGLKKEAAVFFITDILLAGTAAGFNYYSGVRTDEYKDFAEIYAGVDRVGKSESLLDSHFQLRQYASIQRAEEHQTVFQRKVR
jgi:hypothetical protein